MVFHNHTPTYTTFNINWPPHSPDFTSTDPFLCLSANWEESYKNIKFMNARCRSSRIILHKLLVVQLVRKFPVCYKAMFTSASRFLFWCIFRLRFLFSLQWKHTEMETGQAEYQLSGFSLWVHHYSPICNSISNNAFITFSCSLYSVRFI
jgi:hypothetical protein